MNKYTIRFGAKFNFYFLPDRHTFKFFKVKCNPSNKKLALPRQNNVRLVTVDNRTALFSYTVNTGSFCLRKTVTEELPSGKNASSIVILNCLPNTVNVNMAHALFMAQPLFSAHLWNFFSRNLSTFCS